MTVIDIVPIVSQLDPDARARRRHGGRAEPTSPRSSAPRRIPAQQLGQANPTVL